ncbi:MAG: TlpA disulfide reductase family protein [Anaerolineales bacterium]
MSTLTSWIANPRRWWSVTLLVALLGAGWIFWRAVPAAETTGGKIPSPRQGFLAPAISLEQLEGGELDLASLRGKVVIVNYWATWCPPCRAEMPALERTYQAHKSEGLEILAVNATNQDSIMAVEQFVSEYGLSFPILLDEDGSVGARYQTRALPSTYFIDKQGVIQKVIIGGPMSETTLRTTVKNLLEEDS